MNHFAITVLKHNYACVSHLSTSASRAHVEAHQRSLPDVLYVIVEPAP